MIKKILFAAVFSGTAFAAQAQSAGFSITGTISPSPCTISLGGGGVNDYGRLTKESLHLSTFTGHYFVRDEKHMSVAVNCPAPTKFALAFADNRESSAFITKGSPGEVYFGLGTHNGESIGSARFRSGPGKLQIRTTVGGVLQTPAAWLMTTGVAGANSSWEGNVFNYYFRKNKSVAFVAMRPPLTHSLKSPVPWKCLWS
jgi:type 1 fimbria pilin